MHTIKNQQSGFTLIELVMVIVILGILAATALPRFVDMGRDARIAAVNGVAGGMRSAVGIVQARYAASGGTGTEVLLQGQTTGNGVVVASGSGIPDSSANGIGRALTDTSTGFTFGATTATYRPNNLATCQALYTAATGVVTVDTSGC